jgi:two-component system cell cycle response regulator DivK
MTADARDGRRGVPESVLIADDHDHTRSAARLVLENAGFAVSEARTGYDALVLAQIIRPRVMLVDIVLPEIDGLALTRMLRADPALRHCAIIAFTAFSGSDYRDAAFAAGCDEFATKPVAASHLVGLVRQYARRIAPPADGREVLTPSLPSPVGAPVPR